MFVNVLGKTLETSQYNAVQFSTTAVDHLCYKYKVKWHCQPKLNNIIFVKEESMAELLYCIALDIIGVPVIKWSLSVCWQ